MPDLLSPEVAHIRELAKQASSRSNLSLDEARNLLTILGEHECWDPYFRLIKRLLNLPSTRALDLYIQLARAQNLYLEDVFGAAETCAKAVRDLKLRFVQVSEEMLPRVMGQDDFATEATILSAVAPTFIDHADHVQSLERLCLLYEKKIHNDRLLANTYDQLLEIDSGNVKALRYFKIVYTQHNEWEDVARTLRSLLAHVTHPQELYRVAQELAGVLLYHLDQADAAIQIIENFCSESPLDTSMILYDAYERIDNNTGCLKILRESLLTVSNEVSRAKVLYKIGVIQEKLGEKNAALEHYRTAFELWPLLLEAAEGLIGIAIEQKNWSILEATLETLASKIHDERLKGQLVQAKRRLKDGVGHASRT